MVIQESISEVSTLMIQEKITIRHEDIPVFSDLSGHVGKFYRNFLSRVIDDRMLFQFIAPFSLFSIDKNFKG